MSIRLAIVIFVIAIPHFVLGAEPSAINLTKPMLEITGKPVMDEATRVPDDPIATDPACSSCKPLTAATMVIRALISNAPSEQNIPGEQKAARYALAQRILANPSSVILQSPEVTVIKRLVGAFPPAIVGQIYPLIAPNDKVAEIAP